MIRSLLGSLVDDGHRGDAKTLFEDHLERFEEMRKSGLRMLVVIVSRGDGEKAIKFLRKHHFHFQFACLAQGTSGSEIMDMLGLGTSDKTVLICVAPERRVSAILLELSDALKLSKPGKGIAFTIPLDGIFLPVPLHGQTNLERLKNMETKADIISENTAHSVILAIVNHGCSQSLVEAVKAAGAKGGTVINARRTGVEEAIGILGIPVQSEKEIVMILTKRESKMDIMNTINESFGLKSKAQGIVLSLPVDGVMGIVG